MSNRSQELADLQHRYAAAIKAGRRLSANIIFARMRSLMTRKIKTELRTGRKAS